MGRGSLDQRDRGLHPPAAQEDRERARAHRHGARPRLLPGEDPRLKIFQREQRSLFGEILDWMLTQLLLLWPVRLALTWLVAQSIAGKPFDRALEYNVHAHSQLVSVQNIRVAFNLPQPARELLRADDSDLVYYQVLGPRGEILSGEREIPKPPDEAPAAPGEVRLRNDKMRDLNVRVAS